MSTPSQPMKSPPTGISEPEIIVDARGLLCPMPIFRSEEAMARMPLGSILRILATDPGVQRDIPAWCQINGHILLNLEGSGRSWSARVEKGS